MPFAYKILEDQDLLYIQCFGVLEVRDALRLVDDIREDPRGGTVTQSLVDLQGVTGVRASMRDVFELGALRRGLAKRRGKSRRTALWAPGDTAFTYAQAFQIASGDKKGGRFFVCRALEDALSKLGLNADIVLEHTVSARPRQYVH